MPEGAFCVWVIVVRKQIAPSSLYGTSRHFLNNVISVTNGWKRAYYPWYMSSVYFVTEEGICLCWSAQASPKTVPLHRSGYHQCNVSMEMSWSCPRTASICVFCTGTLCFLPVIHHRQIKFEVDFIIVRPVVSDSCCDRTRTYTFYKNKREWEKLGLCYTPTNLYDCIPMKKLYLMKAL